MLKLTLCGQEAFSSIFMTVSTIKVSSTKEGLLSSRSGRYTVLRFGVKVAVVRYLNFSKNAKNGFKMQFQFILNVFCQEIDKFLHTSVQFYTETMTTSLSNCLILQVCY